MSIKKNAAKAISEMKTIKVLRFYSAAIIFAVMSGFFSCKDDDPSKTEPGLEVNPVELTFGNASETREVQIAAGGEWTATAYNSWCTVSPSSGSGAATLTVSVDENPDGENRSSTVEIVSTDGGKTISKEVAISQLAYIPFVSVNNPEMSVSSSAGIIEMVVKTNMPKFYLVILPTVQGWKNPSKKEYVKPAGAGTEWETSIGLELAENTRPFDLQGSFVIGNSDASIKATFVLTQKSTEYAFFEAAGGQQQKEVAGSWTASSNANWFTVPSSGSGNIAINVSENTDLLPRIAAINITSDGVTRKIIVAQEPKLTPDRSQTWTDANGTRHTSIPADKKFWETGDVLEYHKATKGNGVKVVFFNDAFNKMEMAVGGVYETVMKELTELFFAMPVVKDYKDYFDIYILMTTWEKSGLYNQHPNGGYRSPTDGRSTEFRQRINAMPQLQGTQINGNVTGFYVGNGMAGGYMSAINGMNFACYSYNAEQSPPGWMIHEFMGHAFANLGDQYDGHASNNISDWDFYLKNIMPVTPAGDDPQGEFAPHNYANNRIVEWNQDGWDAFIGLPGNAQYAGNLDSEYRRDLPSDYRQKHPSYTGGDYIWRTDRPSDFMVSHNTLRSTGYDRWLVYRRIMRLAGVQYSLPDFFANDQQYANETNWYNFLGLNGWWYSVDYDPHNAQNGSPFKAWDVNEIK